MNVWRMLAGEYNMDTSRWDVYSGFSLRSLLYFLTWMCMWQGWSVAGSPFQIQWPNLFFPGLFLHEVYLAITAIFLVIERVLQQDFTFERSYFGVPILTMFTMLIVSWLRGIWIRGHFSTVYEAHDSIQIVISYFIFVNLLRDPEDRYIILPLLLLATVMKALDGIGVKIFGTDPLIGWGVLMMWRDGFLLALGITSVMLLMHYRGIRFRWLKYFMLAALPFLIFTLIISYRRTFFVGLIVSAGMMFFTVGKGRRKKQVLMIGGLILGLGLMILFTDPLGFIARLFAVVAPTEEGSAAIRLMEYPNVIRNIIENPILGTPIGIPWPVYYNMPLAANYTTLGTHNTYLYWPLRTGIVGTFGFLLLLCRWGKAAIVNLFTQKTEEDFLINQISLHMFIIYLAASFLGLMYGDAMAMLTGLILAFLQLQIKHQSGLYSYREVEFWKTLRTRKLQFRGGNVLPKPVAEALTDDLSVA